MVLLEDMAELDLDLPVVPPEAQTRAPQGPPGPTPGPHHHPQPHRSPKELLDEDQAMLEMTRAQIDAGQEHEGQVPQVEPGETAPQPEVEPGVTPAPPQPNTTPEEASSNEDNFREASWESLGPLDMITTSILDGNTGLGTGGTEIEMRTQTEIEIGIDDRDTHTMTETTPTTSPTPQQESSWESLGSLDLITASILDGDAKQNDDDNIDTSPEVEGDGADNDSIESFWSEWSD